MIGHSTGPHLIEVTEIGDNVKGLIYVQKNARSKQSSLKSLKLYEGWQRSNVMLIPPKGNLSAYTRYDGSFELTRTAVLVSGVKFLPSGSRKTGFKLSAAAVSKLQPFSETRAFVTSRRNGQFGRGFHATGRFLVFGLF